MSKMNEDFIKQIKEVRKIIPADNEEYSSGGGISPLKRHLRTFVRVEKFKNLDDMASKLVKMSISDSDSMAEEYMNKQYHNMDDESQDVIKGLIISTYDYSNNELAYARASLQTNKTIGLINIANKDLDDYVENDLPFQERDVYNSFSDGDLIDFPQYLTQDGMFKDTTKGMNSNFYKKIVKIMADMDEDEQETMTTLLQMADIASDSMGVISSTAEISVKYSTIRNNTNLTLSDDDEEEKDDDDILDEIEYALVDHLGEMGMKSKKAKKQASGVRDDIDDAGLETKQLYNIKFLLNKKHNALYTKNYEEDIVAALNTTLFYMSNKVEDEDKSTVSSQILPFAMISRLIEESIGDIIDLDEIDEGIISAKADKSYDPEEIEEECNDLEEVVALDIALRLSMGTFLYGVIKKNDFYKDLAKKTIPKMTVDFLENVAEKVYEDKVNTALITKFISSEHKSYKDRSDLILEAASAIKLALEID